MKKNVAIFIIITILFVFVGFMVKSTYYYLPYADFIEYFLSFIVIIITLVPALLKKNFKNKSWFLSGFISIVFLMGSLDIINLVLEWNPPTLNLQIYKSESFETSTEPYKWTTAEPETCGYDAKILSEYFKNISEWKRLRCLLVVKDNKLIIEKYLFKATKYSNFDVHSITKSITSALTGLAIQHKFIKSEDELILPFFPEYGVNSSDIFKKALTIKHLLTMRGGWISWNGHRTVKQCIKREKLHVMPDSEFHYFTGSLNIVSAIITKKTNLSTREFADQYLLKPLGIRNGFWRKIGSYYCGGDESFYSARDLARFGLLYLNKGNVDDVQILDTAWIDKTFISYTKSSTEFHSYKAFDEIGYGYSWWILESNGEIIYAARGKGGQYIILIPEKKIVLVILQEWNPLIRNAETEGRFLADLLKILIQN